MIPIGGRPGAVIKKAWFQQTTLEKTQPKLRIRFTVRTKSKSLQVVTYSENQTYSKKTQQREETRPSLKKSSILE
jgi:hypothetical protein